MKSQSISLIGIRLVVAISAIVPGFANVALGAPPKDIEGVKGKLCQIMDWIYTFALIVGIVCVILAAFNYITSGGSSEKVSTANKALLYAVIGITVALLAASVPTILGNFIGNENLKAC